MLHEEALALLREQHEFPGLFHFRVVVLPEARGAVLVAMGPFGEVVEVQEKPSTKGNYLAMRVSVRVAGAEEVVAAYEALQGLPGFKMAL
jgi:putative lipoic acid-binding regulatory protein